MRPLEHLILAARDYKSQTTVTGQWISSATNKQKLFKTKETAVKIKTESYQTWWCMPIILVLGMLKQEDMSLRPP
jgi:hypothetical protein